MNNKQNDHYREKLKEANQECKAEFERAMHELTQQQYWLMQQQWDEEDIENDLEMYPNE